MVQLSVIIPVYNVEPYLQDCLDSVLHQEFTDMEIICVNDFSTDSSLDILRQFSKLDSRIKVIEHDCNRGLSAARNTGLASAAGKYVWFIDSDDVVSANACRELYELSESYMTDIVYFNMSFINEVAPQLQRYETDFDYAEHEGVMSGKELFCLFQSEKTPKIEAWRQFFRRDFLIENNLWFCDHIVHEDNLFSFECAMAADRVMNINRNYYNYRQRYGSIIRTYDDRRTNSLFVILSRIYTYWNSHSFTVEENKAIEDFFCGIYKGYRYVSNFSDYDITIGTYPERVLHKLMHEKSEQSLVFSADQLLRLKSAKYIILYGAGHAAVGVLDFLSQNDIIVNAVAVSDAASNPSHVRGIKVQCIDELSAYREAEVIVGVTQKYADEVIETLKNKGFQSIIRISE